MTITTIPARQVYSTDGVVTIFTVPFEYTTESTLLVYFVSSAGTISLKTLNVDYTVVQAIDQTGTITFAVAPANGGRLVILRRNSIVQATSATGIEEFSATQVESIVDLMMLMMQETRDMVERSLSLVLTDPATAGRFDALVNRIINVVDPVDPKDAVTKIWAETAQTSSISAAAAAAAQAAAAAVSAQVAAAAAQVSADAAAASASSVIGRFVLRNVAGTAQAITAQTGLMLPSILQYMMFLFNPASNITGPDPTILIDAAGSPLPIKGPVGQTLGADEMDSGIWYELLAFGTPVTEYRISMGY